MRLAGETAGCFKLHLEEIESLGVEHSWKVEVALQEQDEGARRRRVVRWREDDVGGTRAAKGTSGLCAASRGAGRCRSSIVGGRWRGHHRWGIAPVSLAAGEICCFGDASLGSDEQGH